jgi:hypothetical protein
MRIHHIIYLLFVLSFTACKPTSKVAIKYPMQTLSVDMLTLASDEMEGRETGQKGELLASEYIIKRFKEIGLSPKGDNKTFIQTFSKKLKSNPHTASTDDKEIIGRNVVGFIDNGQPNTIVIGAHYDHLGYGESGSLHAGEKEIHNGADDNASGVTGLFYLAESLKKSKFKNNNYLFIAFSGEEKGLLGSNFFVNNPTVNKTSINYMVNMDMIGRLSTDKKLLVGGVGTSPVFDKLLDQVQTPALSVKKELSGSGSSDHMSFYNADIPVISFFTGQHNDYHKPSDDANLINFSGMQQVLEFIYQTIGLLDKEGKLTFTKTVDNSASTRTFSVTLGVMPDYLFDGKGMRIDGVRDGKPAAMIGLQKGDVIVRMGEYDIEDMQGYMQALGKFEKGQTIILTFMRNNEKLEQKVTF